MLSLGIGHVSGDNFPVSQIVGIPFIWSNSAIVGEAIYELYHNGLLPEYEEDFHVMWFHPTGMQKLLMVNEKITDVKQLNNMLIRGNSGETIVAIESFGATAVSIGTADLYMALETGVVDGAITSVDIMRSRSFFEPCNYLMTLPIHGGLMFNVMNKGVWESLPAEYQVAIGEVFDWAYGEYMNWAYNEELSATEYFISQGMDVYSIDETAKQGFVDSTTALLDNYVEKVKALGYDGDAIRELAQRVIDRFEFNVG